MFTLAHLVSSVPVATTHTSLNFSSVLPVVPEVEVEFLPVYPRDPGYVTETSLHSIFAQVYPNGSFARTDGEHAASIKSAVATNIVALEVIRALGQHQANIALVLAELVDRRQ